jgi:hypothetical protein
MSDTSFWGLIVGCVVLVLWRRIEIVWACHELWRHDVHWLSMQKWRMGLPVCPVPPYPPAAFRSIFVCVLMLGWTRPEQMLRTALAKEVYIEARDLREQYHHTTLPQ